MVQKIFKNIAYELYHYKRRIEIAVAVVAACFLLLLMRLLWLQVVNHDRYSERAESNRTTVVPLIPYRGLIYDRNGLVVADNTPVFVLQIVPDKVVGKIDNLINELNSVVPISERDRRLFKSLRENQKFLKAFPLKTYLSEEEVARFSANALRFPGVDLVTNLYRRYPQGSAAAHVLGYIGRINDRDLEQIAASPHANNYLGTEFIGKEGIEKSYEADLHGTTGIQKFEVSAARKTTQILNQTMPVQGKNLYLTIDMDLQNFVYRSFGNRKGALVAINPNNGEVLVYVSSPSFDPNLFVQGIEAADWEALNTSEQNPMLNRPIAGLYPPGSTYKPFMSIAALDSGVRTPERLINDPGYYMFGNHKFRDSNPRGRGAINLKQALIHSSDTYFYGVANDMGVDRIHNYMKEFGFGELTGIDLEGEKKGILPSTLWKRTAFKKPAQKKWFPGETISLGVGQGYNTFTPMQLAHALTILINDGRVIKPHIVRSREDPVTRQVEYLQPEEVRQLRFDKDLYDFVKAAMEKVPEEGTAASVFANTPYRSGGKTGTAQVISIKQNQRYDKKTLKEEHHDHSWYIGYAPAEQPQIVVATIVENGGFGAESAAPIVKSLFDYLLIPSSKSSGDTTN